jgi:hypothetical protein
MRHAAKVFSRAGKTRLSVLMQKRQGKFPAAFAFVACC